MSDVNAFLKWNDDRDAGTGPAKFAINKYSNNKGPFSKRTDYVIFDNILKFEISEYTTN
ncbi:galactose oxidase [Paenibacillus xylanexedens]|uniref:galactose oxidase n=1 Tax=Paenibacillus xylanexedens TaxID=528191 RepID=UPI0011A8A1ED|nr:galactose oxidase [Paenibacillus xylanexedens]